MVNIIISAIIAEYNPFHNGHLLHINETIKATKCDYLIVILSGSFTQRCAPSIVSKWERAKSAILGGADLVIELPFPYSCASAHGFSFGAISILNSLNIVDYLSFGSENGDIYDLLKVAIAINNKDVYEKIYDKLKLGHSYHSSMVLALENENCNKDILCSPNNILAVEYLATLNQLNSKIIPYTIKRNTALHNERKPVGNFASATYIRNRISKGKGYEEYLPDFSYDIIKYANRTELSNMNFAIMPLLKTFTKENFYNRPEISEGLENRILQFIYQNTDFETFLNSTATTRYSKSRIRRAIFYSILNVQKEDMKISPNYVRILGMNKKGTELINIIKEKSEIPIITKPSSAYDILDKTQLRIFEFENKATDFFSLYKSPPTGGGDNLRQSPFILK